MIWWGLAPKTQKLYSSTQNSYHIYCLFNTTHLSFSITFHTLASWVIGLAKQKIQPKTIKTYFSGLRSTLVNFDIRDLNIFYHFSIYRLITGIKKRQDEANKQEHLFITRNIFLQLFSLLDIMIKSYVIMHTAYCLAFAAFLRIGEFTYSKKILATLTLPLGTLQDN